ncbi:mucin-5AC-like [Anomaloglossus baeobatrachus]|uniref:mucin-5AC-like n=1 Tax=Anomaloglossus baeobatrachus TaxID=238106 RepID=UPI003F4F7BB1
MVRSSAALLSCLSILLLAITVQSVDDERSCARIGKGFSACRAHCQPSCDNRNPQICTHMCNPGCICKKGFINNGRDNECIKPAKCSQCKGSTTYSEQGNKCTESCKAVINPKLPCTREMSPGCFCKKGYVFLDDDKTCVRPQDCPRPGPGHNNPGPGPGHYDPKPGPGHYDPRPGPGHYDPRPGPGHYH